MLCEGVYCVRVCVGVPFVCRPKYTHYENIIGNNGKHDIQFVLYVHVCLFVC